MDRVSHQRHAGLSPLSDREVEAGVAFLIEFLGDDYPKTMLDAEDLVRGLASAIRHAPSAIEGYRDQPDAGHQANPFAGLRKLMASERLFLVPMSELLRHQSD